MNGTCINATVMKQLKTICRLIVLMALAGLPTLVSAQSDLNINKVFKQYEKNKNAVMVSLSNEVLGDYEFSLFKSINIKNDPSAANFVREQLALDEKGAKKIKQVVSNGKVTSIYLDLAPKKGMNRLILFNEQTKPENQLILIYIESENSTDDILKILLKKN
jgi:hypothetical protein